MHLCVMYSYQTLFAHCLNPLSPCNAYWCCILDHSANLAHPLGCKKGFKFIMQYTIHTKITVVKPQTEYSDIFNKAFNFNNV